MKPQALADALIRPRRLLGEGLPGEARLLDGDRDLALYFRGDAGAPRRALLVHGWETDHRDMDHIASVLSEHGAWCVLPDLPAHGGSTGETMMIPDGAEALVAIDRKHGPFDLCVAHSMGCAIALAGMSKGLRVKAVAFLASPSNYVKQLSLSARAAGAPEPLVAAALDILRKRRPELDDIDSVAMAKHLTMPGLLVVAGRDQVLDPQDSRKLEVVWPDCVMLDLPDASHRSVLRDAAVIDAIVKLVG